MRNGIVHCQFQRIAALNFELYASSLRSQSMAYSHVCCDSFYSLPNMRSCNNNTILAHDAGKCTRTIKNNPSGSPTPQTERYCVCISTIVCAWLYGSAFVCSWCADLWSHTSPFFIWAHTHKRTHTPLLSFSFSLFCLTLVFLSHTSTHARTHTYVLVYTYTHVYTHTHAKRTHAHTHTFSLAFSLFLFFTHNPFASLTATSYPVHGTHTRIWINRGAQIKEPRHTQSMPDDSGAEQRKKAARMQKIKSRLRHFFFDVSLSVWLSSCLSNCWKGAGVTFWQISFKKDLGAFVEICTYRYTQTTRAVQTLFGPTTYYLSKNILLEALLTMSPKSQMNRRHAEREAAHTDYTLKPRGGMVVGVSRYSSLFL